jgi:hypothetical protein
LKPFQEMDATYPSTAHPPPLASEIHRCGTKIAKVGEI